jgi:hypothetical protein
MTTRPAFFSAACSRETYTTVEVCRKNGNRIGYGRIQVEILFLPQKNYMKIRS